MLKVFMLLLLFPFTLMAGESNWDKVKGDIALVAHITDFSPTEISAVAFVESSFRANVGSSTSSAKGLMQITSATAKHLLEKYGEDFGIEEDADIMDPRINLLMGTMYLTEIRDIMSYRMGREVSIVETYLGYKFSPYRATRMLKTRDSLTLASFYPEAAKRNQSVYYKSNGEARTLGEVKGMFAKRLNRAMAKYGPEVEMLIVGIRAVHYLPYKRAAEQGMIDCNIDTIQIAQAVKDFNRFVNEHIGTYVTNLVKHVESNLVASRHLNPLLMPTGKTYNGFYV